VPKQRTPLNDVLDPNKTTRAESGPKETQAHNTTQPSEAAASSEEEQIALATEQPVPSVPQEKTSQYVVTVDNQTGLFVKVEKLTAAGERQELSQEEYERAIMEGFSSVVGGEQSGGLAPSAESEPLLSAYYQGVADYLNNLT
jgi:hypothetical protein